MQGDPRPAIVLRPAGRAVRRSRFDRRRDAVPPRQRAIAILWEPLARRRSAILPAPLQLAVAATGRWRGAPNPSSDRKIPARFGAGVPQSHRAPARAAAHDRIARSCSARTFLWAAAARVAGLAYRAKRDYS